MRKLTILLNPAGCSILCYYHLTELVSYEAQDVLGCALVQVALLHRPRDPQAEGLIVKLVWSGEAIHPDDAILAVGKPR